MAKIYGLFGAMTGKVADVVMLVRNGEQIVRKHQPVVSNPSTAAQVAVRAKLKLMSQLSAVLAPSIAIPSVGAVSSRNQFVKENYPLATFSNDEASINLNNVQITKSQVGITGVSASRTESGINVFISSEPGYETLSRVVYVAVAKQADGKLRYAGSQVSDTPGGGTFGAQFPAISGEVVFLAYGVRDNTDAARVAFGNIEAPTAEQVAKLITSRTLTETDVTLTETKGFTLAAASANANHSVNDSEGGENRSTKKK